VHGVSAPAAVAAAGAPPLDIRDRWGTAWRSPIAAAGMAAAASVAVARFGMTPRGFTMAFFLAVLVTLSVIDVQRRILPNAIVGPSAALVLAAQIAAQPGRAPEWILAACAASALLFVLFLVNPAGMGMGDVKLALLLGAGLGWQVIPALVIASFSVWPVALYLFVRHGAKARTTAIPFGPFLAFGAMAASLLGGLGPA
jgi:leader peptidase (prepilin peptidase) / N-methyltransferase